MQIWKAISVKQQPVTTLERWSVYELADGSRHFVGRAIENHEGRVSSRIEQFDVYEMVGVSASGRVYKLVGRPGYNSDAAYTWYCWQSLNNIKSFVDVSKVVWTEHENTQTDYGTHTS